MENRTGLVISAVVTHVDGHAGLHAALAMLDTLPTGKRRSVGADEAYDSADCVAACRQRRGTPHLACNDSRSGGCAIDGRTTCHGSYRLSQIVRKRIEEHFGWGKTVGMVRQTVFRGLRRVDQHFKLTMTASNLMASNADGGAIRSSAMNRLWQRQHRSNQSRPQMLPFAAPPRPPESLWKMRSAFIERWIFNSLLENRWRAATATKPASNNSIADGSGTAVTAR